MKILSAQQTRELDQYTITHEPIASIDLMERASNAFVDWFRMHYRDLDRMVVFFCGTGNNGGDGLAVARLLHEHTYRVRVYLCAVGDSRSPDNATNLARLREKRVIPIGLVESGGAFPPSEPDSIVVDALFGSGLSRPVEGYWAELLVYLNTQPVERVAIDLPSGLFADLPAEGPAFQAHRTLSFQLPKLAFFLPANGEAVGEWAVRSIGLSEEGIAAAKTNYYVLETSTLQRQLRRRGRFDHKGTFGHALIVAGSYGKMGASILCSRAALRAGAGLVTVHAPRCGYEILQIAFPEAMVQVDDHQFVFSEMGPVDSYQAIGVGPGLGTDSLTCSALEALLKASKRPLVMDADALNLMAYHPHLWAHVPEGSILTPHPKEFKRLFGPSTDDVARLELQRAEAQERRLVIVLKTGATSIAAPDGRLFFNTTGNPGMGTAGTGDVLTGILTGLLAQGYDSLTAAQLGVYLHGLAGDLAAEELEQECLLAEDVIRYLGRAFRQLKS